MQGWPQLCLRGVSFEHECLLKIPVGDTNYSTWSMMGSNEFTGCVKPYTTLASSASNVPDGRRRKKNNQQSISKVYILCHTNQT